MNMQNKVSRRSLTNTIKIFQIKKINYQYRIKINKL
jgi:hypothetical protein